MEDLVAWDVVVLALVVYGIIAGAVRGWIPHLTRVFPLLAAYALICSWNPAWPRVLAMVSSEEGSPTEMAHLRAQVEAAGFVALWLIGALVRRKMSGFTDEDRAGQGRLIGAFLGLFTGTGVAALAYAAALGSGVVTGEDRGASRVAEPFAGAVIERTHALPRALRPTFLKLPPRNLKGNEDENGVPLPEELKERESEPAPGDSDPTGE